MGDFAGGGCMCITRFGGSWLVASSCSRVPVAEWIGGMDWDCLSLFRRLAIFVLSTSAILSGD